MGSLQLNCPLCCSDTFDSHDSLKYHLLSIIDNLICPSCNLRFNDILKLCHHLEESCTTQAEVNGEVEADADENEMYSIKEKINGGKDEMIKNGSILAKLLRSNDDELQMNSSLTETADAEYFCEGCNMHFTSVEDHLNNFHSGHVVMVESEENGNIEEETTDDAALESDLIPENNFVLTDINEEEIFCTDKDGRPYTRKMVKIGKFWKDSESSRTAIEEKYSFVDVDDKKLINEEPGSLESIITLLKCSKCSLRFSKYEDFQVHKCSTNHTYMCPYGPCKAEFLTIDALNAHIDMHVKNAERRNLEQTKILHRCKTCKISFPSARSLHLHERMHKPIIAKKTEVTAVPAVYDPSGERDMTLNLDTFSCPICHKIFYTQYEEVHMKSHGEEDDFVCTVCNKKFYSQENLNMHARAHSATKNFSCSHCKKTFTNFESLKEHSSGVCQMRKYDCSFCGRKFSRPHEKVKHERIHTGDKPHICEICGKSFRVSYCLTLHMRTHTGVRPYKCSHCGKRFKSHSVFNHHLSTHSDERPYKCPFCPKAFKTSVQLAGHKNSHTKPFTCNVCNRPFASLYAVRGHMETHKRENNLKYECWTCGAIYARAFALRDHLMSQHNKEMKDNNPPDLLGDNSAVTILSMSDDMMVDLDVKCDVEAVRVDEFIPKEVVSKSDLSE